MLQHRVEIQVLCSPAVAFAFVATDFFANHRRWDPGIVELTQTSAGPIGVGTTGVEVRNFGGRQAANFRVTDYTPDTHFAFTNTSGPFALDRAYRFSPRDGGTAISFSFTMQPKALPVRILWPLLRGVIAKQVTANIERLQGLLVSECVQSNGAANGKRDEVPAALARQ